MERPLVSIIVPVYNVEDYLERGLNSIRAQTWDRLEVWLANDASTDGSLALCRRFESEDSRFHVLDLPHGGVSAARNATMDRARGKYLQFMDGDDYLTPDATETLVRTAEATGADLTVAHFYRVSGERCSPRGHIKGERVMTRGEFAQEMCKAPANFYYGVLWNKLYRRSIVEAEGLRCPEELSWCEDFLFNLEYLRHIRLAAAVPKPIYYYIKREDSLVMTRATLRNTIEMKRTTFACYKRLYQALDLYEKQKVQIYGYLVSGATDGVSLPELPKSLRSILPERDAAPVRTHPEKRTGKRPEAHSEKHTEKHTEKRPRKRETSLRRMLWK